MGFDSPSHASNIRTSLQIQELFMKALITAVALLSFVAASTVPLAAQAATKTEQVHKVKHAKKTHRSHKAAKNKKKHVSHAA
jgi:hypothetical protein